MTRTSNATKNTATSAFDFPVPQEKRGRGRPKLHKRDAQGKIIIERNPDGSRVKPVQPYKKRRARGSQGLEASPAPKPVPQRKKRKARGEAGGSQPAKWKRKRVLEDEDDNYDDDEDEGEEEEKDNDLPSGQRTNVKTSHEQFGTASGAHGDARRVFKEERRLFQEEHRRKGRNGLNGVTFSYLETKLFGERNLTVMPVEPLLPL